MGIASPRNGRAYLSEHQVEVVSPRRKRRNDLRRETHDSRLNHASITPPLAAIVAATSIKTDLKGHRTVIRHVPEGAVLLAGPGHKIAAPEPLAVEP